MTSSAAVSTLCLSCGLCCDGVLFKDVELQAGDDAPALLRLGLPVRTVRRGNSTATKAPQPCAALCSDLRCQIYRQRPLRCRQFECALLKSAMAGEVSVDAALKSIRLAQARAEKVRSLLRTLSDHDEDRPLSLRFKRTQRRLETTGCEGDEAAVYGRLTQAVHALNLLLSSKFYPG